MNNYFTASFFKTLTTSSVLTMLFVGNSFAQQKLIAEKQVIPVLADIEQYNSKNPQLMANGCDTVNYNKGFKVPKQWRAINWTAASPNSGLVHGTNSLGDTEKGNYLDLTSFSTATHITAAYVWFFRAYSTNPAKTVSVNVYDDAGAGGSPGALLGSQTVAMSVIMSNYTGGFLTRVVFSSPVVIPASKKVFVTCDYSNLSWTNAPGTDSLSIIASDTLEENPGIIWEKASSGTWHPLDDGTTWNFKQAGLFIMPFITNSITPPSATVTPTPANATICEGNSIAFDPTGSVAPFAGTWTASPGYASSSFSGQNLVMTYTVAGTYTVSYNAKSCGVVSSAPVSVLVNPSPTLTASSNSPVCEGFQLQLSAATNGTSYLWTGPNGFSSTLQNPVIATASVTNSGNYSVTAVNSFSCTNTQIINVTVNPCTGIHPSEKEGSITIIQNENQQYFLIMDDKNQHVKISIFNISGVLISAATASGAGSVELNTRLLPPGMYFVQVGSPDRTLTKKMIIAR